MPNSEEDAESGEISDDASSRQSEDQEIFDTDEGIQSSEEKI